MPDNNSNQTNFAARSYYFTVPGSITQSTQQAFGPKTPLTYRLTASFTSTGAMAYAICKGVILVQPQTGSNDKVNLILRPLEQPMQGINIKYFIYRGLNRADFFSGDNIKGASGASDLIVKINEAFTAFYAGSASVPEFKAKFIGFEPTAQSNDLPLDAFFFKDSVYVNSNGEMLEAGDTAFELPLIEGGKSLGGFLPGECGIDVVLSYGDYQLPQPNDEFKFDLNYARAANWILDVSTESSDFKKKQVKEQIFQFLDVAAYYGAHSRGDSWVKTGGNGSVTKTGTAIYTDLLQGFDTKNTLYLYIQSDRTRSYNFYSNYQLGDSGDHSLKLGRTPETLTEQAYADEHGWPVIIDKEPQNHDGDLNRLYLRLVTDNNPNVMLWGQVGVIENAEGNNFCGAVTLHAPIISEEDISLFTNSVILSNPSSTESGEQKNIGCFNIILYQNGSSYELFDPTAISELSSLHHDDRFIGLFNEVKMQKIITMNSQKEVVAHRRIKLSGLQDDKKRSGMSAVQITKVKDLIETGMEESPTIGRVLFLTGNVAAQSDPLDAKGSISSSESSIKEQVSNGDEFILPKPYIYECLVFNDGSRTINGIKFKTIDNSIPGLIGLGISSEENQVLSELITADMTNCSIGLIGSEKDMDLSVSPEGISYYRYQVCLIYEPLTGGLNTLTVTPAIDIYTLDQKYFFSRTYSQYMKGSISEKLIVDFDIAI